MAHTPSTRRGISLIAACSVLLLLSACSGSTPSTISTGSGKTISSIRASASSSAKFGNYLSSAPTSSAPFFSMGKSSSQSSASVTAPAATEGALHLTLEADSTEVRPGSAVYQTVTVKNTSTVAVQDIKVKYAFSPTQQSIVESDGEKYADYVTWHIDSLEPGRKRALRVRTRIVSELRGGEAIWANATVMVGTAVASTSTVQLHVSQPLPPTGAGDGTRPVEDVTRFLRPL